MSPADVTTLEAKLADAEETCDRLADEVTALAAEKASLLELLNQAAARADREQALKEAAEASLARLVAALREAERVSLEQRAAGLRVNVAKTALSLVLAEVAP